MKNFGQKNNTNNLNCVVTKIDFDYAQDIKESIIKFYYFDELILLLSAQSFECNINNIKIITKEEYNKERSKEKLKSDIDSGYNSTSMIQRHLLVGYPKACEIMDELREKQL